MLHGQHARTWARESVREHQKQIEDMVENLVWKVLCKTIDACLHFNVKFMVHGTLLGMRRRKCKFMSGCSSLLPHQCFVGVRHRYKHTMWISFR